MNIYYVYQYLRKDMTPYYIGKGSGNRAYVTDRVVAKPKDETRIQIIASKLSETESFLLETKLIKHYGRIDLGTGILRNMTDGGDGASGRVWTAMARLAVSKAKTEWHKNNDTSGKNNPMYGRQHSKEVSNASRERALKHGFVGCRKGKDPWNKGKTTSQSTKRKQSESRFKTPKKSCQHCGILVAPHILSRFHGERCKLATGNNFISKSV